MPNLALQSVHLPCPLTDLPSTILCLHLTLFLHSLTLHYSPLVLAHSPAPTPLSQLDQDATPRHKQEVQVPVFSPCAFCPVCAAVPWIKGCFLILIFLECHRDLKHLAAVTTEYFQVVASKISSFVDINESSSY